MVQFLGRTMENRVLYSASEWGGRTGQPNTVQREKEKNRRGRGVRRKRGEEVGDREGETLQSQGERERERKGREIGREIGRERHTSLISECLV